MMSAFGLGQVVRTASWRLARKSVPGMSGMVRRSPPAMITEYWWIG